MPDNLKSIFVDFSNIAVKKFEVFPAVIKKNFRYLDLQSLEKARGWYLLLKHELLRKIIMISIENLLFYLHTIPIKLRDLKQRKATLKK